MEDKRKVEGTLKALGCRSEHLDLLVQDQKMQQANRINSVGMETQVQYLLKTMTGEELVKTVQHELQMLKKYHMKQQSKLPEGNVRAKRC